MSKSWEPRLIQKGFILVAVPLVFEIIFVLSLAWLLNQAENDVKAQIHAKNVIFECAKFSGYMQDAGLQLGSYSITTNPLLRTAYEASLKKVPPTMKNIEELFKDEPIAFARFQEIEYHWAQMLEVFNKAQGLIEGPGQHNAAQIFGGIKSLRKQIMDKLETLVRPYRDIEETAPEQRANTRHLIEMVLFAGVGLNVLLSIWLVHFFSTRIVKRLKVVSDNSLRLAAGQSLLPPLTGSDEIGSLDSEFHAVAAALKEASRKEYAIIDNAVDVICSIDARGKFVNVNRASTQAWGFGPDELIGKGLITIVHEEDREKTVATCQGIRGGQSATFENRIVSRDGRTIHMLWSAYWSEADRALFCVAHDISDRKEVEQFRQDLIAMVSHDLRSPLTSIQVTLNLLSAGVMGNLTEDATSRVRGAERNAERLISLINDLLDIERMEAGKLDLHLRKEPLADIFARSVDSVLGIAEKSQVSIAVDDTPHSINGDADRIVQVMVNLLSNAIKFSPANSTIKIQTTAQDSWITVQVIDQGRGVPQHKRQQIFERFKQVEREDATKKGGTGLGLPICKAIIEGHGGTIGVESEDGKGSTFFFTVPRA